MGGLAKESIIAGRALNLALLDKNLLLLGHCPGRIFEDLRCNSAGGGRAAVDWVWQI